MKVVAVLRRLRLWPRLAFGMASAKTVARIECGRHSWPWTEPVACTESWFSYHFRTNSGHAGANADVWVDGRTGEVRSATYLRGVQVPS